METSEIFRIHGVTFVAPKLCGGFYSVGDLVFSKGAVFFLAYTQYRLAVKWTEPILGGAFFYYRSRKRRWESKRAISQTDAARKAVADRSIEDQLRALPGSVRINRASISASRAFSGLTTTSSSWVRRRNSASICLKATRHTSSLREGYRITGRNLPHEMKLGVLAQRLWNRGTHYYGINIIGWTPAEPGRRQCQGHSAAGPPALGRAFGPYLNAIGGCPLLAETPKNGPAPFTPRPFCPCTLRPVAIGFGKDIGSVDPPKESDGERGPRSPAGLGVCRGLALSF